MTARRRAVPTALLGSFLLVACSSPDPAGLPTVDTTPSTVEVVRRDITSVLVVAGTTSAMPEVTVSVPVDGVLQHEVGAGTPVVGGQVLGTVGGEPFEAPADGELVAWLVEDDDEVLGDVPLAVVRYQGLAAEVPIPPTLAYRVYSEPTTGAASIEGGPAGVPCRTAPLVGSAADLAPDVEQSVFACLLPAGTRSMPGLPANVGLETAVAQVVLALPVEAVLGSAQTGKVTLVEGGERTVLTVTLGISDGASIEIVDGLAEGDVVEAVPPGLTAGTP